MCFFDSAFSLQYDLRSFFLPLILWDSHKVSSILSKQTKKQQQKQHPNDRLLIDCLMFTCPSMESSVLNRALDKRSYISLSLIIIESQTFGTASSPGI